MENPAVSVIVPVYNVEQYIKMCIDSILNQTFRDFEIILVDDASPDNSIALCQKLYGGNEQVKFVRHEKNLGLGAARNTGIKNSRGKYVYFVDSDDFILPAALEKLYYVAEKSSAQVVHAAGRFELTQDEPAPVRKENLQLIFDRYDHEGFLEKNLRYRLELWKNDSAFMTAWLNFCRRDFLDKNRIEFLPIISEDGLFHFALLCFAERYYLFREAVYVYRKRSGSIMTSYDMNRFSKGIHAMIIGAAYIGDILDRIPKFDGYEVYRENFMAEFFVRFLNSHTAPFYRNLQITAAMNETAGKTLQPFFGNDVLFVKYFFNGYHIFRRRTEILLQQNQYKNYLLSMFIKEQPAILEIMISVKSEGKKIFIMGTPRHGNLGDQAIALGELHVLKKYFPEHTVIEIPYDYLTGELGELIWGLGLEKFVQHTDIIALHGGGNLGNLWLHEEQLRRKLIEKFPENKIIIFPQSIYFTDDDAGHAELDNSKKIYNAHKDLHLMTRDENSFDLAQKIFPEIHNYLLPDAATVLPGMTDDTDVKRGGVLLILRDDKEKVRDESAIQRLQKYLVEKNIPFTVADTIVDEDIVPKNREQKVHDILAKIRGSKLIITDRFHGVIFSFITRTPVLAFKSFDTKISSGIKWFKNLPTIFYAENQDWTRVEEFISQNYFSSEDDDLNALKFFSDSPERFRRALNQIVRAGK